MTDSGKSENDDDEEEDDEEDDRSHKENFSNSSVPLPNGESTMVRSFHSIDAIPSHSFSEMPLICRHAMNDFAMNCLMQFIW